MKAAFSKIDITPSLPVRLSGFGMIREAYEVLDPVYARINYFKGDEELLWIQFDLCGVDNELIELVKEKTQIQNCLLSATHTHSGPCGTLNTTNGSLNGLDAVFGFYDEKYVEWISERIKDEVNKCKENAQDVKIRISKGKVSDLGSDRHDNSYGDEDCLCLEFKTDTSKAMIVRLACHPTVMNASNLMISADFCGEIEKNFDVDMVSYVNGSCGDISTRFTRHGNGIEEKERLGKVISKQIKEILNQNNEYEDLELKYIHKVFDLETKKVDSMEEAITKLEIAKQNLQKAIDEGKDAKQIRVMESFVEGAQNNLLSASSLGNVKSLSLSVSALNLNGQCIIFTPVELFSKLSNPYKNGNIEFVGYTNGYLLYMPDSIAYDKNYYESFSSPFKQGAAEIFMNDIVNWAKEIM